MASFTSAIALTRTALVRQGRLKLVERGLEIIQRLVHLPFRTPSMVKLSSRDIAKLARAGITPY
jgi:hypothetical protein